jgi:hypothetical protein
MVQYSEISLNFYQTARRHISVDISLHSHQCENPNLTFSPGLEAYDSHNDVDVDDDDL